MVCVKKQLVRDLALIFEVNNLNYQTAAKEIGITHSTLASLMTRETHPTLPILRKIEKYIDENLKRSTLKQKYLPIKIFIRSGGQTVEDAAREIGISSEYLQAIIDGKIEPARLALRAVETWMGFTVAEVNAIKAECRRAEEAEE